MDCWKAYFFLIKYSQKVKIKKDETKNKLFYNDERIIKCKERIQNSEINEKTKFSMFLPLKCIITKLLILEVHITNSHTGIINTLSLVREFGWVTGGRRTV